jgi:cob(I)alamin adenosyltransferase
LPPTKRAPQILDNKISTADIDVLEHLIDDCLAVTGPQRAFVVPGRDAVSRLPSTWPAPWSAAPSGAS